MNSHCKTSSLAVALLVCLQTVAADARAPEWVFRETLRAGRNCARIVLEPRNLVPPGAAPVSNSIFEFQRLQIVALPWHVQPSEPLLLQLYERAPKL